MKNNHLKYLPDQVILIHDSMSFLSGKNMDYQSISELLQRIQATGSTMSQPIF
ncbi:hypothetical protein ACX1EY_07530 [Legionella pneumophila]